MKSGSEASFYLPGATDDSWISTPATAGPWGPQAQHGGPPSGLLTRALEALLEPGQTLGRITIDLLGPVPVGPLATTGSEDLDAIAAIQSFYPMVEAIARARGRDPDRPPHLNKVTRTQ